ncbi:ATPase with role in protein import into the ER, partial [Chytriomyces hyalinus]
AFIKKNKGKDPKKDLKSMGKLKREVEKAKRALSSEMFVKVEIESFYDGVDFAETLTRAKFEELNIDLFKKTLKPVEKVLKDAGVDKHEIHEIVLVGGSTRIPKVVQLLEEFFNGKKASNGINPEEAVAYGAAVHGGIHSGDIYDFSALTCFGALPSDFGSFCMALDFCTARALVELIFPSLTHFVDYREFGEMLAEHLPRHEQYFSGNKPKLTINAAPSDLIHIMNSLR